jgi:hypothetical protein
MTQARPIWRRVAVLAIGGGLAFWLANLAISLTPLAAEYRAALSISYVPMLGEALVGGLILGCCVAYALVRRGARVPVKRPVLTAIVLSMVALTAVTLLIEVPAKFLTSLGDPVRYFLIGTLFNLVRILALGAVVGFLYDSRGGLLGLSASPARRGDQLSGDLGHTTVL